MLEGHESCLDWNAYGYKCVEFQSQNVQKGGYEFIKGWRRSQTNIHLVNSLSTHILAENYGYTSLKCLQTKWYNKGLTDHNLRVYANYW